MEGLVVILPLITAGTMHDRPDHGATHANRLLAKLTRDDLLLLQADLKPVDLRSRSVLEEPRTRIDSVYFLEDGIASVVTPAATRSQRTEIALIGREGMSGATVMLGDRQSPHLTYMQIAGRAQQIGVARLRRAMYRSESLQALLLRYVESLLVQISHTAVANSRATLEERLARWLLMLHDRLGSDRLPLTHSYLALMLGVRRPSVTVTLHALEHLGFIRGGRGAIIMLNREGLVGIARNYYGVPEAEFERLLA